MLGESGAQGVFSVSGVALPTTDLIGRYSAKLGLTLSGSEVIGHADQSPESNDLVQSGADTGPTYDATGWDGSQPGLVYDETSSLLFSNAILASAGPVAIYALIDQDAQSTNSFFLDSSTGRFVCLTYRTGQVGFFISSYVTLGAYATGKQLLSWRGAGSSMVVSRDGVAVGTGAFTEQALGGTSRLGATFAGGSNEWKGTLADVLIYGADHDASDEAAVIAGLESEWGTW